MNELSLELQNLHRAHGCGTIAGVHFDFRNDEVSEGWEPIHALGFERGNGGLWVYGKGPRLLFPWSKPTEPRALRRRSRLRGRSLLRDIAKYGPDGSVDVGDTLSIATVSPFVVGSEFEPDQDAGLYRVRYRVTRPDGRVERVRGYSVYVHRDSHWALRSSPSGTLGGLASAAVRRRLAELLRPEDIGEDGKPTDDCEMFAANCHDALSMVELLGDAPRACDQQARDQALIEAGFYLAKAEAEIWMAPYAERGLGSVKGGTIGGRNSGEKRRTWIADNWEPHALEIARTARAERPAIGQSDLASEVQFAWTNEGKAPGHDWILEFVRAAEKDGRLQRRVGGSKGVRPTI